MTATYHTHPVTNYIVKILNGMAQGLFASLIIGLILKQIGVYLNLSVVQLFGQVAMYMMGPAIGVGVAMATGATSLVVFASAVTGALGAGTFVAEGANVARVIIGEPVGALLASLIGAEIGRRVAGKTKFDILLVPIVVITAGGLTGVFLSPYVAMLMKIIGEFINTLTTLYPVPMGILVAAVVGMVLTLPISSAAICISLGISGLAAGAATVGCASQMVGFAMSGFKENRVSGLISQGLGTSMIQMPNIVRNWRIWVPPTLTAAILGPFATTLFQMQNNAAGAGMGTSGLVGQINTLSVMGPESWWKILLLHFLLPGLLSLGISNYMRKKNWIKAGDYQL